MQGVLETTRSRALAAIGAAFLAYPAGFVAGIGQPQDCCPAWQQDRAPDMLDASQPAALLRFDLLSRSLALDISLEAENLPWRAGR